MRERLLGGSKLTEAFAEYELLPPIEMAGCTARIFELAAANLAATDAAKR